MNLDFHVHGLLTKKSNFDEELFLQGIEVAKEQGLDGYILCEHFNARYIDDIHNYLRENYVYVGDKYIVNNFSVFIGMEVDIKNGGHIIVAGNRDKIELLKEELQDYKIKPNFIKFEKLLDLGEKYECLMIGSHPYRESHKLYLQPKALLARLHGLDLNSTDLGKRGIEVVEEEVSSLSKEIGVPYVTGSDSHFPIQLGSVMTKFKTDFQTVADIRASISSKDYEMKISKALDIKVLSAKITKKYLKENTKENIENFKDDIKEIV